MPDLLIALGSNLGDRAENLRRAVEQIGREWHIRAVSGLYETAPKYVTDQPAFLNAALLASTVCSPMEALHDLKSWEAALGRTESVRFGPREIDLDIVAYADLQGTFTDGVLTLELPHPRAAERRFVLAPLAEIAPDYVLPGYGSVSELLAKTIDPPETVQRL